MRLKLTTPKVFQDRLVPRDTHLAGWAALVHALDVQAPVRNPSCVSEKHVKDSHRDEDGFRVYDKRYQPGDDFADHLTFALRNEAIDLLILRRVFEAVPADALESFIAATPNGTHTRRAWFFYETLTGRRLDLDDAPSVTAVDALDPDEYFVSKGTMSQRHKVRDNLLGNGEWCPVIRRTEKLEAFIDKQLSEQAAQIIGRTGRHMITRASSFMLLADSRASFEIEGERPPRNSLERWSKDVMQAGRNELTVDELVRMHEVLIEDMRFILPGLRPDGVFLGERDHLNHPLPEFIGARPDDLDSLCDGMIAANNRMREENLDAVLQATATAFGFVYVHPFQDGNGRVHRCVIHHVLAERKYTPPGMVFPVSSVMLDRIDDYRETLQSHAAPLLDFIEWHATGDNNVEVLNDTADLYRYFDCTEQAEFLYECVEHTVEYDLPREIDYLSRHDIAMAQASEVVPMPGRLAQNLITFIRQNDGALPKRRRQKEFAELTDEEIEELEAVVNDAFEGFAD